MCKPISGDFLLQPRHDARTTATRTLAPSTSIACAFRTRRRGHLRMRGRFPAPTACQSAKPVSAPVICTCDTTVRGCARELSSGTVHHREHHDQRGDARGDAELEVSEMKEMK